MDLKDEAVIQKKILEPLRFGVIKHISQTEIKDATDIDSYIDHATGNLVFQLRARIMAEKIDEHTKTLSFRFTFDIPASWWDDFKERWMPAWFTQRFPVRYRTIERRRTRTVSFKKWAKYPSFPPPPASSPFIPVYESMLEPKYEPDNE